MSTLLNLRFATLAMLCVSSFGIVKPAIANSMFGQQEVDQKQFAVIASPYSGGNAHQLLIVKQISSVRPCWSESGSSPTVINPLLAEFDFTNICGRSTDSNGYSMRVGGEDQNWKYSFRVVKKDNDLQLVAYPNIDRSAPELLVARTRGYTNGFAKFYMEPGWRVTERTFQGQNLGHVYLTNDQTLASLNAVAIAARPTSIPPVATKPPIPVVPSTKPPVVSQPAPTTPPVAAKPTPTPQANAPKPTQNRRLSLWERIFGQRRANQTPQTRPVSTPVTQQVNNTSATPGNFVVPVEAVNTP